LDILASFIIINAWISQAYPWSQSLCSAATGQQYFSLTPNQHQPQPASSTFLSQQISISHQPQPASSILSHNKSTSATSHSQPNIVND